MDTEPGTPPSGPAGASSANKEEGRDAFDPENFQMVLLIQMMRTYDILLALLAVDNPQKALQLSQMHEAGLTFTPAPAFSVENEQDEE